MGNIKAGDRVSATESNIYAVGSDPIYADIHVGSLGTVLEVVEGGYYPYRVEYDDAIRDKEEGYLTGADEVELYVGADWGVPEPEFSVLDEELDGIPVSGPTLGDRVVIVNENLVWSNTNGETLSVYLEEGTIIRDFAVDTNDFGEVFAAGLTGLRYLVELDDKFDVSDAAYPGFLVQPHEIRLA